MTGYFELKPGAWWKKVECLTVEQEKTGCSLRGAAVPFPVNVGTAHLVAWWSLNPQITSWHRTSWLGPGVALQYILGADFTRCGH